MKDRRWTFFHFFINLLKRGAATNEETFFQEFGNRTKNKKIFFKFRIFIARENYVGVLWFVFCGLEN